MDENQKSYFDFLIEIAFVGEIEEDNSTFCMGYKRAINSAYRDLQRTMSYKKIGKNEIIAFKNECRGLIGNSLEKLLEFDSLNEATFDDWHKQLCIRLTKKNIPLTIGQAQKWVNMTLKYLCVLEEGSFKGVTGFQRVSKFFHVPIDTYVIRKAIEDKKVSIDINKEIRKYSISKSEAWSKWNDYSSYKRIQDQFRQQLDSSPFNWELTIWEKNDSCSERGNH